MSNNEIIIELPNKRSSIKWTSYLATAYAEGFCEGENATQDEQLEAWACIIKTKLHKELQGWFGRNAEHMITSNYIKEDGTINWDNITTNES